MAGHGPRVLSVSVTLIFSEGFRVLVDALCFSATDWKFLIICDMVIDCCCQQPVNALRMLCL